MDKTKDEILEDLLQQIIENAATGSKEVIEDDKYEVADLTQTLRDNYYFIKNELGDTVDTPDTTTGSSRRARSAEHKWYGY
jgi:hypothetical protein